MPFQGPAIPESYAQPCNRFEYPSTPLDTHEIRILEVRPGLYRDEVIANLATTRCNNDMCDLEYDALSYTWGAWTESHTVILNGKSGFHVTDNVFNALRRLRLQHGIRRLWIDALCINQGDVAERNAQLQIMGRIYKNARRVLVWLGDGGDKYHMFENQINCMYESTGGFKRAERESLALALFSTQPHWWDRTWVVQEFAMAVQEPMVLFGKYKMSYSEFENKVNAYFKWENRDKEQLPEQSSERWTKPLWGWFKSLTKDSRITNDSVHSDAQSGMVSVGDPSILDTALDRLIFRMKAFDRYRHAVPRSLVDTAWRLRDLVATSPHDKIFGLLALMRQETASLLNPDYASPVANVYALATFAALREPTGEDFRALSLVTFGTERPERQRPDWKKGIGQPRVPGLPSWAVDFSFPLADAVGSSIDPWKIFEPRNDDANDETPFLKCEVNISEDFRHLRVNGCRKVGQISSVVPIAIGSESSGARRRDLAKLVTNVKAVMSELPSKTPYKLTPSCTSITVYDFETFDQDLLVTEKTIITRAFEVWDRGVWPQKTQEASYISNRDEITRRLVEGEGVIPYERETPVKDSWNPWNPDYSTLMSRYLDYTLFTAGGSAVFATADGFLGIANRYVSPDDLVIMLDESPQFIILRPVGEDYTFLGFALVHGLMRSELQELSGDRETKAYMPVEVSLV